MPFGPPFSPAIVLALGLAAHGSRRRTPGAPLLEPVETRKSKDVKAFLQMDAEERFDLETLNAVDLRALAKDALAEKRTLREVMQKVEELSPRVRAETEDTTLAGSILRNKTLDWYLRSPSDPTWAETMGPRWGGIFHESRVPGGRLSPKLSSRLASLHMECSKASGWFGGLLRTRDAVKMLGGGLKRLLQPLMPQVAQAYLDDLASASRNGERPFGLERISELARRITSPEMNRTLGELFRHEGGGPVIVLDARYHPDIGAVVIRPPPPRATGDAISYDLVHAKTLPASAGVVDLGTDIDSPSPWEGKELAKKDWNRLLVQLQKRKSKLEPPPIENYRDNGSYVGLRDLILADPAACKAFRAVRWKGKPSGLLLLADLLSEGTFEPEVDTDADYVEGELGHIEKGDPDYRPEDGRWKLGHGWTVVRKIEDGRVRSYKAARSPAD